jgi:hypothetical protein
MRDSMDSLECERIAIGLAGLLYENLDEPTQAEARLFAPEAL